MAQPIVIGRPLPRARDAYVMPAKWSWILGPKGHGRELTRVFLIGPSDTDVLWHAILNQVRDAPVIGVRDTADGKVSCRVDVDLSIGGRSALVRTAWHYESVTASPRLVTAFPTL